MTLIVNNLACMRGERLLFKNINLTLPSACVIQIVGENGSGKTSLLRIVAGLLQPTVGHILWNQTPIENHITYRQALFYLHHALGIKNELTVLENICYSLRDLVFSDIALKNALQDWALFDLQHHLCQHISQGQRQRVTLTMLSLSKKSLWILDEPFSSLDERGVAQLIRLFERQVERGGSIIFATHRFISNTRLSMQTISL